MLREIITIDEGKCNGCGLCVPGCPEGAIQIIDGKARLISDLFCDGLGACLGHCPEGAITIEKQEAQPYDERRVMENIIQAGPNTIKAHLAHLKEHGETVFLKTALDVLDEKKSPIPGDFKSAEPGSCGAQAGGCPGSRTLSFDRKKTAESAEAAMQSELSQWPVQLHLVSPNAPYFRSADVVLAADCTAFAVGDFHRRFLRGKALAIACPKLDEGQDIYLAKLTAMIDQANINTLTVVMMQVPCCGGLLSLAKKAVEAAGRKIPVKKVVVSLQGEILQEGWV
ncbi:4Fe-4S binding protein [bacterium]|nr:4Fe-4S binding protein [bacterium]